MLKNHDRNIGLVLREHGRQIYDFESYLAGTLPMSGVTSAFLATGNGSNIPLDLDEGAFYGEGLPSGQYTLNLVFSQPGGLLCRLPVTIDRSARIATFLNLQPDDIRRSVGYLIKYPGKPEVFDLLWGAHQIRCMGNRIARSRIAYVRCLFAKAALRLLKWLSCF